MAKRVGERYMSEKPKKFCNTCNKDKVIDEFYNSDSPFDSDGKCCICKTCMRNYTINPKTKKFDINRFKAVLQNVNKPYIASVFAKAQSNTEGVKIVGDYMRMMNSLPQYKGYTYADSVFEEESQAFTYTGDDSKVIYESNEFDTDSVTYDPFWMGYFTSVEIKYLNDYYEALNNDYDIKTKNHMDYAKKISKASLYMDKCFQDMLTGKQGAEKAYNNAKNAFDGLCKSAKFSESTRTDDNKVNSMSLIISAVETHNWIYEHQPINQDQYDELLGYLRVINKSV